MLNNNQVKNLSTTYDFEKNLQHLPLDAMQTVQFRAGVIDTSIMMLFRLIESENAFPRGSNKTQMNVRDMRAVFFIVGLCQVQFAYE